MYIITIHSEANTLNVPRKVLAIKYIQFPLSLLILISHFLSAEFFNFLSKTRKMKSWCSVPGSGNSLVEERRVSSLTLGNSFAFCRQSLGERKSSPQIGFSSDIARSGG